MLKNPNYVYGKGIVNLPSHLNLGQYIVETLRSYGNKNALINGVTDERLTYREMVESSINIAVSLTRMGVTRGDTIAICSENRKEYWSAFIGTSCTGATFTTTSIMYSRDELIHVLNISKPKMIFCSPLAYKSHKETLQNIPFIEKIILFGKDKASNTLSYDDMVKNEFNAASTAVAADIPATKAATPAAVDYFVAADVAGQVDTALILYSSGTTGLPKGVMLTHVNVLTNCSVPSTLNPVELPLIVTPWSHAMGLLGTLCMFMFGNTVVYLPKYESDLYFKTISKYKIVQLVVAPPILVALCKTDGDYDVSSVKMAYSGAAPLRSDTINEVKRRFPNLINVIQVYGMTETTLGVTRDTHDTVHLVKSGAVGRTVSGMIVKIVDIETRKPLGANQPGEICIKGPLVMKGYVGKDRSDDFDDEGFYRTDELKHVLNISKPKMVFCSLLAYKSHEDTFRDLPFIDKIILFGKDKAPNTLSFDDLVKTGLNTATAATADNFIAADVTGQVDTALILYSSGTTGLPKGVMLSHVNVITNCSVVSTLNPVDLSLMITPWYHTMGLMGALRLFTSGGTLVYIPKFESSLYLKTIAKYKIVQLVVPPPVLVAVCKIEGNNDVSSVKMIYSGAAPLRSDTIEDVKKRFPNVTKVLQGYGMTEATLAITRDTYDKAHLAKPGGVGNVISGSIVKIVDIETGKTLGANQPGEICVKGPLIMKGYVGKNRSDDIDDEGFYRTGDIGYYDDDKYFFIVDRLKELIKYKGYQVPPAEIEAVLLQHPSILDAGVIGVPDDSAGEVPRAYVVLQPGAKLSEGDVKRFVAEKLSNPKHLRGGVHFATEIPKNPSGKILRRKLREMARESVKSKL